MTMIKSRTVRWTAKTTREPYNVLWSEYSTRGSHSSCLYWTALKQSQWTTRKGWHFRHITWRYLPDDWKLQ